MQRIALFMLFFTMLHAESISVVASVQSDFDTLTQKQLHDLFLSKRSFIGSQKAVPVNLLANNDLRKAFDAHVLQMHREKLNAYWVRQHFQGVVPPLTQSSTQAVKKFVQNVEGAIGYIPSDMLDPTLKVLYEF